MIEGVQPKASVGGAPPNSRRNATTFDAAMLKGCRGPHGQLPVFFEDRLSPEEGADSDKVFKFFTQPPLESVLESDLNRALQLIEELRSHTNAVRDRVYSHYQSKNSFYQAVRRVLIRQAMAEMLGTGTGLSVKDLLQKVDPFLSETNSGFCKKLVN